MQLIYCIKDYHMDNREHLVGLFTTKEVAYIGTQQYLDYLIYDARTYLGGKELEEELDYITKVKEDFLPMINSFKLEVGHGASTKCFSIECLPVYEGMEDFFRTDNTTDLKGGKDGN